MRLPPRSRLHTSRDRSTGESIARPSHQAQRMPARQACPYRCLSVSIWLLPGGWSVCTSVFIDHSRHTLTPLDTRPIAVAGRQARREERMGAAGFEPATSRV
jgi:hypothetical protein